MATGRLVPKRRPGTKSTYWAWQHSYRVKVDPRDRASGKKGPGSGKSRVVTDEIYLGTADEILRKIREGSSPTELDAKAFGLECAALAVAKELNLIGIIDRHVAKRRQGLSVGEYLVIGAINRICQPTSRSGIKGWIEGTVLPEKMQVDPNLLKSQNFWDAWDKLISEGDVKARRKADEKGLLEEGEPILDASVILDIEHDVWRQLLTIHDIHLDPILYDTTNFYTYLEPTTKSDLCKYAKSKDEKHGRRCVGLALGLTGVEGLPFSHMVYAANTHDSKLFPEAMAKLSERYAEIFRTVEGMTLVFDKGNNSKRNIQEMAKDKRVKVVGSLVPSQNLDLMRKNLRSYRCKYKDLPAYREEREVFGIPSVVVVTFNERLKRRQKQRLEAKLSALEQKVSEGFEKHNRKETKQELQDRIDRQKGSSDVGRFLEAKITGRRFKNLKLKRNKEKLRDKQVTLGKTIMFATAPWMSVQEVADLYRSRNQIEETFKLEKAPKGIPFRPQHCWTDSKIRVYAFVCVLALLIWRLMLYKLRRADLPMSDQVLRMELAGIQQIILAYPDKRVERKVTKRSPVQEKVASVLGLYTYFPRD